MNMMDYAVTLFRAMQRLAYYDNELTEGRDEARWFYDDEVSFIAWIEEEVVRCNEVNS